MGCLTRVANIGITHLPWMRGKRKQAEELTEPSYPDLLTGGSAGLVVGPGAGVDLSELWDIRRERFVVTEISECDSQSMLFRRVEIEKGVVCVYENRTVAHRAKVHTVSGGAWGSMIGRVGLLKPEPELRTRGTIADGPGAVKFKNEATEHEIHATGKKERQIIVYPGRDRFVGVVGRIHLRAPVIEVQVRSEPTAVGPTYAPVECGQLIVGRDADKRRYDSKLLAHLKIKAKAVD